jgi:hypothetical protein
MKNKNTCFFVTKLSLAQIHTLSYASKQMSFIGAISLEQATMEQIPK